MVVCWSSTGEATTATLAASFSRVPPADSYRREKASVHLLRWTVDWLTKDVSKSYGFCDFYYAEKGEILQM